MPRILLFLILLSLAAGDGSGQGSAQRGTAPADPKSDSPIKLTLRSSRAQLASDTAFEVNVTIENTSDKTIYITSNYLTLTLPPEVDPMPPGENSWSQWRSVPGTGILEPNTDPWEKVIPVQPGSRMLVTIPVTQLGFWHRFAAGMKLVPADYTMHVVCAYWTSMEDAGKRSPNFSTQVADLTVPFVAPLPAILGGAALGGFLAFVLLPNLWLPVQRKLSDHHWLEQTFIIFRGFALSALLSVVVAILLSRVSGSQFLVSVSVQDFWGSVAVGFIAAASGTGVLQRWNLSQARRAPQEGTPAQGVGGGTGPSLIDGRTAVKKAEVSSTDSSAA